MRLDIYHHGIDFGITVELKEIKELIMANKQTLEKMGATVDNIDAAVQQEATQVRAIQQDLTELREKLVENEMDTAMLDSINSRLEAAAGRISSIVADAEPQAPEGGGDTTTSNSGAINDGTGSSVSPDAGSDETGV